MIKVMSFNIRIALADDGENNWDHRKFLAADRIRTFAPDLLGLQECYDGEQAAFVKESLPEYSFFGVRREGPGDTALELAPLLFRNNTFLLLRQGVYWLSETPEIPGSKSWDSVFPRTLTWAKLLHRQSGRTLTFANTHFDYQPLAIEASARLLYGWAEQVQRESPLLLTGDFNADKNSTAYQRLTSPSGLLDAHRSAHPGADDEVTFHAYGKPDQYAAIDWLLISNHFRVIETGIDHFQAGNVYPSDHFPVHARVEWEG